MHLKPATNWYYQYAFDLLKGSSLCRTHTLLTFYIQQITNHLTEPLVSFKIGTTIDLIVIFYMKTVYYPDEKEFGRGVAGRWFWGYSGNAAYFAMELRHEEKPY